MKNALQNAIDIVNGQSELARRITDWFERNGKPGKVIKQQHVWKWLRHPSGIPTVPPEYRLAIQEITEGEVTVVMLSHDIYGSVGDGNSCACQS
ncbi:MAG: helix-turn-helix domain-containing protein [Nitrosomonas sp.]|jgi:hypothetical protein|nr:helix-turn-helix domain-containing protein [Nitrosomonas sp.]